jgi:transposase-like protein
MNCPYCESDNVRDLEAFYRCQECDHTFSERETHAKAQASEDYSAWAAQRLTKERGRANARNLRRYGFKGVYR